MSSSGASGSWRSIKIDRLSKRASKESSGKNSRQSSSRKVDDSSRSVDRQDSHGKLVGKLQKGMSFLHREPKKFHDVDDAIAGWES
mmetsp:Transcript_56053/g.137707  ORF Transcript_56053/g.137707 Transcript_56053/m.137707 type:complete len:86 (+) Transcript_56053:234-491(+)